MENKERYPTKNYSTPYFKAADFAKKMETGEIQFSDVYSPERRDNDFWLRLSHYVYGSYSLGYTYIKNGGYLSSGRTVAELRAFARGEQDTQRYKKMADFRTDKGDRKELNNISWENTRVFNRPRQQCLERLSGAKHKPGVRAMDTASNEERQRRYLTDRLLTDPRTKMVTQQLGMPAPSDTPMLSGMSQVDVDVLNNLGGYTLASEILTVDAIQASLGISGWDEHIRDAIDEDLLDIGFCGWMIYRMPGDGKYQVRYCDPAGLIVPISNLNDCSDSQYRAVIERRTIASLRMEHNIDEETLLKVAKTYSGVNQNPAWSDKYERNAFNAQRSSYSAMKQARYDEFSVDVMTTYFRALDIERYICGTHANGNRIFDKVRNDYQLDRRDLSRGKELVDVPVQYMYKCHWIVGTEYVFDCGVDETCVRAGADGAKEVIFPLQVYALNEPSKVEQCITVIDDIEIATRKKRLSLATLPPGPSYMVDTKLMSDSVQMGDDTYSILELLGIYYNTGFLYYSSVGEFQGNFDSGSNRPPVTPMPSQKLQEIQTFLVEISGLMGQLRDTLGLNEVADGSANPGDLLNGIARQMSQTANSALRSLFTAVRDIYINTEKVLGLKYKTSVLYGDIEIKYVPGSRTIPKVIKLDKSIFDCDFYFTAEAMPTLEDKQAMIGMLQKLSQERRITEDVFFTVMSMIQEGDVKKAQYFMSIHAGKAAERERQMAVENIQLQAKANAESAQVAEQARARAEIAIMQSKTQLERVKGEEMRKTEEVKHRFRLAELTAGNFQNAVIPTMQPTATKSLEQT